MTWLVSKGPPGAAAAVRSATKDAVVAIQTSVAQATAGPSCPPQPGIRVSANADSLQENVILCWIWGSFHLNKSKITSCQVTGLHSVPFRSQSRRKPSAAIAAWCQPRLRLRKDFFWHSFKKLHQNSFNCPNLVAMVFHDLGRLSIKILNKQCCRIHLGLPQFGGRPWANHWQHIVPTEWETGARSGTQPGYANEVTHQVLPSRAFMPPRSLPPSHKSRNHADGHHKRSVIGARKMRISSGGSSNGRPAGWGWHEMNRGQQGWKNANSVHDGWPLWNGAFWWGGRQRWPWRLCKAQKEGCSQQCPAPGQSWPHNLQCQLLWFWFLTSKRMTFMNGIKLPLDDLK